MASTILPLRPAGIRASSSFSAGNRKPDTHRPKSQAWWTPLFGWSSTPDYIDGGSSSSDSSTARSICDVDLQAPNSSSRSKFVPGGFTEEKAKQLRARTLETATFHDIMYHSAIASRLASDVTNMSDR